MPGTLFDVRNNRTKKTGTFWERSRNWDNCTLVMTVRDLASMSMPWPLLGAMAWTPHCEVGEDIETAWEIPPKNGGGRTSWPTLKHTQLMASEDHDRMWTQMWTHRGWVHSILLATETASTQRPKFAPSLIVNQDIRLSDRANSNMD